jgi:hypothetical protein
MDVLPIYVPGGLIDINVRDDPRGLGAGVKQRRGRRGRTAAAHTSATLLPPSPGVVSHGYFKPRCRRALSLPSIPIGPFPLICPGRSCWIFG